MGKSREMRLTHICCCCLLYQLGVLSNGIVSGKFFRDFRLALQLPQRKPRTHGSAGLVQLCAGCSRPRPRVGSCFLHSGPEPWEPAGAAGGALTRAGARRYGRRRRPSADGRQLPRGALRGPGAAPGARRRRSEPRPGPPPPGGEEDEELESQELPRAASGAAALSPGAPASWQPPPPPQPPPASAPRPATEPDGEEVLLRIPAFSRDLYLLLRRDGRFLAPRFAVEQRPSPGPGPTRAAAAPRPPAPPDAACFYTGAVLRHPGSLASFSTCGGGLVSAFPSSAPHVPPPLPAAAS
ncbi:A disintegrin and metalloproteinase with thrombospondin motifs 19 [Camelus dromedarius]|uniref:A disintegrin and metalloproteinase with thrombospondin motifs 19 n=1 Tax=Camelus dromedarius TaxID=9838 RepID=A0A5N4EFC2_CAMDR|nr:A disintegrin and metalloproteinase with thrombospondin motifs 19 [Camelus dromedarius]